MAFVTAVPAAPSGANEVVALPGYDLFRTLPGTAFDPDAEGPLPRLEFRGVPYSVYQFERVGQREVGATDTIVRRYTAATTTEPVVFVELVGLQLASADGRFPLYVTLQSDRGRHVADPPDGPASTGELVVTRDPTGRGQLRSSFTVHFDLRLGSVNGPIVDVGALVPNADQIESVTQWGPEPVQRVVDEVGRRARHLVGGPPVLIPDVNYLLNGFDHRHDFHAGTPSG